MIETHAHIYLDQFREDLNEIVRRSKNLGIRKILMPNIDSTSVEDMLRVEEQYPDYCIAMMGLHPCSVKEGFEKELAVVEHWLATRDFLAVGEIGTDLYWDKTLFDQQREAFQVQCQWAIDYTLPVVIHCRESIDETIELVKPFASKGLNGVFHCFTGSEKQAEQITEMGFKLGIGGVVTFKNAGLDKVVGTIDFEHLVLETDSPYLAPVPHRGKRNEPSYLQLVAQKLAMIYDVSISQIYETTTQNANTLFNLAPTQID